MKVFSAVMKIVVALAAIAGIVYVIANYGDKIVAWAKKLLGCCCCDCDCDCDCDCEEAATAEEVPAEAEEAPVVDAEETDFQG